VKVFELPEILAALDSGAVMAAVADAFVRLHQGGAQITPPGHLAFPDAHGDGHLKGGFLTGDDVFTVKLATSFYRNPERGLPVSNGFIAVISARTGEVLALLHDQGQLTDLRTAMAAALAAEAIAPPGVRTLGIVGAGTQARLQARLVAGRLGGPELLVWARDPAKAAAFAAEAGATAVTRAELGERAGVILTTTPATAPLLDARHIRPGVRIVATGADAPGKRELDLSAEADLRLVVDDPGQCIDHGETGWAVRAGQVRPDQLTELGALLARPRAFPADAVVVADLTGVAVQDIAIARSVWTRLAG
jgi:ornithine cyclodeaminase